MTNASRFLHDVVCSGTFKSSKHRVTPKDQRQDVVAFDVTPPKPTNVFDFPVDSKIIDASGMAARIKEEDHQHGQNPSDNRMKTCRKHRLTVKLVHKNAAGAVMVDAVDARALPPGLLASIVEANGKAYPFPHCGKNNPQNGALWKTNSRCPVVNLKSATDQKLIKVTPMWVLNCVKRNKRNNAIKEHTFNTDLNFVEWWYEERR